MVLSLAKKNERLRGANCSPRRAEPVRRPFRTRHGYTLIELVIATAMSTILVGGLASSLLIANKAFLQDTTPAADASRSALVLSQLAADLRHATKFTERTAAAVTFLVPDRNGDGSPETIRYSWSGTPGHSLLYQYNTDAAIAIAANVQQFDLSAITRLIPAEVVLPPPPPITFEIFTEAKSGAANVTSLAIPAPGGSSNGKLLIAAVATDGPVGSTLTGPADWQLLSTTAHATGQVGMAVWWRIAGAAEPANYTFTWTGPERAYGWVMRFGGANVMTPINAFASSTGTGSTPQCPSVTATEGYTMIVRLGGFDDDYITVNNAGMANHTTITVDESDASVDSASGGAAYRSLNTPISTGTSTFALTASEEYITYTLVIAPQPAG